jgi:hypothetical protein
MEDMWDIKRVLESQRNMHNKVQVQSNSEQVQSNSEFRSLILSPTRSPGSPYLQIDVQDASDLRFGQSTYTWKDKETTFPMPLVPWSKKLESASIDKTI